ncbi:biotin/lipoyl attachment domain-containing protein [Isosphaera pallida ATCC 43644]|uniref:Biotin/lipoyl attachment domain-containing protein n=1 Tax=Isosphaera pallida (strain ATCC 43644 / DSM 9630 / IS1B) TaxID=575540 RepID=E8QZN4_ISOPI|nr:acetyl-CoA carboxylase biotin carboxyl carrier protein subunit [Isosphaera pallida]ADV62170.1 biotin/lipoyl attachment domain-containing protein [Isosphaera pallida ATCC 43644]
MKLKITVEGVVYVVEVEVLEESSRVETASPLATAVAPTPLPPPAPPERVALPDSVGAMSGDRIFRAPIPGVILEVKVREGDSVALNQPMMTMESMKMETAVAAPRAGRIKRIYVSERDSVKQGQELVEFE